MKVSVTDTRPAIVIILSAGGVIGPLIRLVIGESSGGMAGIRIDTLAKVCVTVVVVVVLSLEGVGSTS